MRRFALLALLPTLALAANPHDPGSAKHGEHDAMLALVPYSAITHTASGGNWCDPASWGGAVPGDGADVLVPSGVTVTVDCDTARLDTVRVDGELEWANVASRMQVETLVVDTTGRLEIGTEATPITADVEIVITDDGPIDDPMLLGHGIIAHGATEIHGDRKTVHLKVAADPRAGDSSMTLAAAPEGWQVGDTLVLAGTHYDGWHWDKRTGDVVHHPPQDEVLRVTDVSGKVVSFTPALRFNHDSPRPDLKTSVANYSRSITIRSENPAVIRRGHVMFMHSGAVDVRYAAFVDLGRTDKSRPAFAVETLPRIAPTSNVQGRYPFHFHRTGIAGDPAIAIGNAVWASPGWGFVHHDSAAIFHQNASFDTFGAGFVAETGNETGRWSENIAIYAKGISWATPKTGHSHADTHERFDLGRTGDGFWFQGRMVDAIGNVAASVNTGFVYFHRGSGMLNFESAVFPFPEALGLASSVKPNDAPILHFSGNEAFAAREGLHIEKANQNQEHDLYTHLDDFTAWSVLSGAHMSYTSHYILRDFDLTARAPARRSQPHIGIRIGTNSSDFTIIDARIAGFPRGLVSTRKVTRRFAPSDYHAVAPVIIRARRKGVSGFDSVLTDPAAVPLRISLDPLVFDGEKVAVRGTKTDGIGSIPIPAGTDNYDAGRKEVARILERDGYLTSADGRRWFFLPDFYTDRLTGKVYRAEQLVEIAADVALGSGPFSGAREAGTIDPATTPPVAMASVSTSPIPLQALTPAPMPPSTSGPDTQARTGPQPGPAGLETAGHSAVPVKTGAPMSSPIPREREPDRYTSAQ